MTNNNSVDGYEIITFEFQKSNALLYIQQTLSITTFQISILEKFFKRSIFYCPDNTDIIINAQKNTDDSINIIAYLSNQYQDYDFCGNTITNTFAALHTALAVIFDLSIKNAHPRRSIHNPSNEPEEIDLWENFEDNQLDEEEEKLGEEIDKIFQDIKDLEDN